MLDVKEIVLLLSELVRWPGLSSYLELDIVEELEAASLFSIGEQAVTPKGLRLLSLTM